MRGNGIRQNSFALFRLQDITPSVRKPMPPAIFRNHGIFTNHRFACDIHRGFAIQKVDVIAFHFRRPWLGALLSLSLHLDHVGTAGGIYTWILRFGPGTKWWHHTAEDPGYLDMEEVQHCQHRRRNLKDVIFQKTCHEGIAIKSDRRWRHDWR